MERLNRDVEKCENGIKRSDEQMQATILSRLPKRRYESVITSLNGKIGSNDFTYDDFVSEIYVHYEMFIEPYKNRFAEQTKGKHLALNTVSGKGGWKAFKGKCNKCGKQGHKARDCNSTGENKNANLGKKFTGKCFKCGDMGHMARDCKKVGSTAENGMFVGMSIAGRGKTVYEDSLKKDQATVDMNKVAMKNLGDIAEANKTKVSTEESKKNSETDIEGSPKKSIEEVDVEDNSFAKRRKIDEIKEKEQRMSWYDMCATSNEEEEEEMMIGIRRKE
ncbi:hypothetical protein MHU86_17475 [Fragilaria crotonensis]|nr:hypothetical protein MHU86_17475 [Fragilaria crotonensis]